MTEISDELLFKIKEVLEALTHVDVDSLPELPAGTNNIGDVDIASPVIVEQSDDTKLKGTMAIKAGQSIAVTQATAASLNATVKTADTNLTNKLGRISISNSVTPTTEVAISSEMLMVYDQTVSSYTFAIANAFQVDWEFHLPATTTDGQLLAATGGAPRMRFLAVSNAGANDVVFNLKSGDGSGDIMARMCIKAGTTTVLPSCCITFGGNIYYDWVSGADADLFFHAFGSWIGGG